jgi:hypothetical protein
LQDEYNLAMNDLKKGIIKWVKLYKEHKNGLI